GSAWVCGCGPGAPVPNPVPASPGVITAGSNTTAPVLVTATLLSEPPKPVRRAHTTGAPEGWAWSTAPPEWCATARAWNTQERRGPALVAAAGRVKQAPTAPANVSPAISTRRSDVRVRRSMGRSFRGSFEAGVGV